MLTHEDGDQVPMQLPWLPWPLLKSGIGPAGPRSEARHAQRGARDTRDGRLARRRCTRCATPRCA